MRLEVDELYTFFDYSDDEADVRDNFRSARTNFNKGYKRRLMNKLSAPVGKYENQRRPVRNKFPMRNSGDMIDSIENNLANSGVLKIRKIPNRKYKSPTLTPMLKEEIYRVSIDFNFSIGDSRTPQASLTNEGIPMRSDYDDGIPQWYSWWDNLVSGGHGGLESPLTAFNDSIEKKFNIYEGII
jgi:hypothetical protein